MDSRLKILIVDDDLSRVAVVSELLEEVCSEVDVLVAESATSARRLLSSRQFDLMVLDVAIPQFDGEAPRDKLGLELLRELSIGSDIYNVPNYIVGITGHAGLVDESRDIFAEHVWSLQHVSTGDNRWLRVIEKYARHIEASRDDFLNRLEDVDICVLAALREPELTAVLNLDWNWREKEPLDSTTYIHRGEIETKNGTLTVVAASALRMGQVGAAIVTGKILQRFRPKLIVMPGICAGISENTKIGDVIVGEECWAWDTGKLVGEQNGGLLQSGFQPAPHSYKADDFLIARFKEMGADNKNVNGLEFGWADKRPEEPPTLRVGPIATGSSVIANSNIGELIRGINRKTLAVEMEAYAVYATAQSYGQPSPRVLAVKSVCDHADDLKNDNWQQYCAFLSAKTIEAWLLKFGSDL